MKPILFNAAMVRAILSGRKKCTRRIAKIPTDTVCIDGGNHVFIRDDFIEGDPYTGYVCRKCGFGVAPPRCRVPVGHSFFKPQYEVGEILYVRETSSVPYGSEIKYAADYEEHDIVENNEGGVSVSKNQIRWTPSIHMPRSAARIFLRVTEVKLERLQDILLDPPGPDNQVVREGCRYTCDFIAIWENTINKADRPIYGWGANPWVWVYQFERVMKEEMTEERVQ